MNDHDRITTAAANHVSVRRALMTALVLMAVPGCTTSGDDPSTESTVAAMTLTTQSPDTTATATVGATTTANTRAATSTTQPPTTTSESAAVAVLSLRSDGIGPAAFGTSFAETLAVLEPALGAVTSDTSTTYTIDRGDGTYLDDTSAEVFIHPAQRTTCFDNGLCAAFGGPSPGSLALVGWVQNNESLNPPLTTSDGITVGSTWADHVDDLNVSERGCYSIGYATTSGIDVVLSSAGEPFLAYDDDGNEIPTEPDPRDVTVLELSAGPRPGNPEEQDC